MAIPAKVTNHLDKQKMKYDVVEHKKVFTVYDLAQTTKEKMNTIAKTLLVKADKNYHLVVLPAQKRLNFAAVKKLTKAKTVALAKEKEMVAKFKMKPGAMTPFGSLHKIGVILDKSLMKTEKVLMGAGSFTESLRVKMKDYIKAEQPTVGAVSEAKKK